MNPDVRLDSHFSGQGAVITRKYKPLRVVEVLPNCDNFDEDKITLKYMTEKGIDNVRGGSFCQINLKKEHRKTINHMIRAANNQCYECGSDSHYTAHCPNKKVSLWESLLACFGHNSGSSNQRVCYRCKRPGHFIANCYAKTDIYGNKI
jgi:hypothetical protein